jgi:succinate dehydrogenase subunit D
MDPRFGRRCVFLHMVLGSKKERIDEVSWTEVLEYSDEGLVRPRRPRVIIRTGPGPAKTEAMFWLLFSAGGMVAAFLFPIHLVILGIALAAGWLPKDALSYERVLGLIGNPLVKLYLWGVVSLPLYHWAHRFKYIVHHQLGIHGGKRLVAWACYGTAVAGTVLAGLVLLRI